MAGVPEKLLHQLRGRALPRRLLLTRGPERRGGGGGGGGGGIEGVEGGAAVGDVFEVPLYPLRPLCLCVCVRARARVCVREMHPSAPASELRALRAKPN